MEADRRYVLAALGAAAVAPLLPAGAMAAPGGFVMWRDPGCGCCLEWARRVEKALGRKLAVIDAPNMAAVKKAQGVPADLQSCHTALIGGYVFEGHVPEGDIKRLLASRSKTVKGLAVPGMPAGSPGMDVGHNYRQPYKVWSFGAGGKSVFASHG
jgi:hypothetical protein